jgi:hypothetical protein
VKTAEPLSPPLHLPLPPPRVAPSLLLLLLIARRFNRSDWQYVYTAGRAGTPPSGLPSRMFEWAGQFVMRSGYHISDVWAFFDVGPYGSSGHAHRDKLHLNIRGYGSLLLVDSGRFAYQGAGSIYHAKYAPSTRAHNTLTIDNCDQSATPPVVTSPLDSKTYTIAADYDYARGTMAEYDGLKGNASHTRAVHHQRGLWWVVVDHIATDRPRHIEATWHAHPNSTVAVGANASATVTGFPHGSIAVVPASGSPWHVDVVKGLQPPTTAYYQGWYSESYLDCRPAPTLVYAADISGPATFVWLLLPSPTAPPPAARIDVLSASSAGVTVRVAVAGQPDVDISVPLQ